MKPSLETIKRSLIRVRTAGIVGAISAFAIIPINLENGKNYWYTLRIAMLTGFLMGLQKFVRGYLKYDRNK